MPDSQPSSKRLVLVTGDTGVGKTTVVERVVALARGRGYVCAGLSSPAHIVDGRKIGIEAVNLCSGERRLLARVATEEAGVQVGRYTFDPAVIAWADRVLAAALAARPDLLVVDEIGPLELERGGGLASVLEPLAAGCVPRALVVVRTRLLDTLQARLQGCPVGVFTVAVETRESTPGLVVDWLFEATEHRRDGIEKC